MVSLGGNQYPGLSETAIMMMVAPMMQATAVVPICHVRVNL
jgi:hypothetical protein